MIRSKAVFVERKEMERAGQYDIADFIFVYKQFVLLVLKEQEILDEVQFLYCMEKLSEVKN